ncbi:MAG: biopolymer transporter ExbD [Chlamydiales bacterium]
MSYIPDEELKERSGLTLAPMIDFLFLMLAVFASLAVSRVMMRDTDIDLVKSKSEASPSINDHQDYKFINIKVLESGMYTWVTEIRDYPMQSVEEVSQELLRQYSRGLIPQDKLKTVILLKIDKSARWEPILQLMLAVQEAGFLIRPVYEPS